MVFVPGYYDKIDSFLRRKMAKKGGGSTVRVEDVDHTPPEVNHPNMAMDTHDGATDEEEFLPNQSQYRAGTDPIVGCDQVSSKSTLHTESFLNGGQILANAPVSKGDTFLGKSTVF